MLEYLSGSMLFYFFPCEVIYLVHLHPIRRCIKKGFEDGCSERLRVGIPRLSLGLSESMFLLTFFANVVGKS